MKTPPPLVALAGLVGLVGLGGPTAASADELAVDSLPEPLRAGAHDIAVVWRTHPDDPSVLYQVAALYARAGRTTEALAVLERMEKTGAGLIPRLRDGFAPMAKEPGFRALLARLHDQNPPVIHSRIARRIEEGDLVPEGIAYSEKTGELYLGSIKRKIVAVAPDGRVRDLVAPGQNGLGAVVGIRVDDARGELWAVSEIMAEPLPGAVVGVFCFRLADGSLVRSVPIGADQGTLLNDLVVARDGAVYVTATNSGSLIRVDPRTHVAEAFLPRGSLPDPNGIAIDGDILYIAGWYGVTRLDVKTRQQALLAKPAGVADGCLDGLYRRGHDLVGVQNCVHDPGRILRLHLARDGRRIERAEVLESGNPLFEGITTAAIAGNELVFVANTQFRKVGTRTPFDPVKILALPLAP